MSRSNDDTSPRQEIIFIMLHIQLSPATTLISLIQSGVISMIKRRMSASEFVVNIKILAFQCARCAPSNLGVIVFPLLFTN